MVWRAFWPKLVKSMGFSPHGHHEWFWSVKNSQIQPVRCQKGLTRTLFLKKIMVFKMVWVSFWQKVVKSRGVQAKRTPRAVPERQKQSEPTGQMSKRSYGDPVHDRPG